MSAATDKSGTSLPTSAYATDPIAGAVVAGRYRLLQKLGEGGFGIVYLAEQREPVQRTVALKVIKPGMDSAQILARFEQERQALALMDHPNIAKVLDGGTITGIRNQESAVRGQESGIRSQETLIKMSAL